MAFTRKMLRAMSIEEDKIEQIIDAHSETVDALKKQIAEYKAGAEEAQELKTKVAALEAKANDGYKEKYEKEHEDFENFKSELEKKETQAKKLNAFENALKEIGVSESRIKAISKISADTINSIAFNEDGSIKGSDKLTETMKTEWKDFIPDVKEVGANVAKPPVNNGSGNTVTKDSIMSIKDPVARQTAIAQNIDLFRKE